MSHRFTIAELAALLKDAGEQVPIDTFWRHYRDNSGTTPYKIVGHAITERDESVAVLYQNPEQIVFSRPLKEFVETVRGGTQQRFQKIIT